MQHGLASLFTLVAAASVLSGCDRQRPPAVSDQSALPWETEAVADDAKHRLSDLDLTAAAPSPAPTPSADPENVFTEGAWKIRRAAELSFADFKSRLAGYDITRKEIKVTGVTLTDTQAETRALVHLLAVGGGNTARQLNAVFACEWSRDMELRSIRVTEFEENESDALRGFADCTGSLLGSAAGQLAHGIDHWTARLEMSMGIEVSGWHGLALADVDGDGREDIYVCEPGGLPNRLLRQRTDGTLEDISAASGLDWLDNTTAALFCDFDNDGDADAMVSVADGILVMANDGTGRFSVTGRHLFPEAVPFSLSAADYDADGDLDVYACSYHRRGGVIHRGMVARPVPYYDAQNGGRNVLLRNDGDLRFSQATKAAGLDAGNFKFSFAAAWEDYDDDGDFDLYVANDFGANHFYRNLLKESGKAVFEDIAGLTQTEDIAAGMSVCWGDFNNDGRPDIYVGNMFSSAGNRIAFQPEFHADDDENVRAQFRRHARGNSLFENRGGSVFKDVSVDAGVTMGRWAWGSRFADVNNDGQQDLLVANGFVTRERPDDL